MTEQVSWLPDASEASWIDWEPMLGRTQPPWITVSCMLPTGFAAHARILHPLKVRSEPTRWRALAEEVGVEMHPGVRADDLLNLAAGTALGTWSLSGQPHGLDHEVWPHVRRVLNRHSQADSLILGYWDGHLGFPVRPAEKLFHASIRTYALAVISADHGDGIEQLGHHPPCIVWPRDRAWFAHCDIDDQCTYVAGTEHAIADLLACPDVEAIRVSHADGL